MSKRQTIIDNLIIGLKTILISNGYQTDVGKKVFSDVITVTTRNTPVDGIPFLYIREIGEAVVSTPPEISVPFMTARLDYQVIFFYPRSGLTQHNEGRTIISDVLKALFLTTDSHEYFFRYTDSVVDTGEIGSNLISTVINFNIQTKLNLCDL